MAAQVYGLRLLWQELIILTLLGATPVLLQSLCSVFLTDDLLLVAVLLGTFYALFLVSYVVWRRTIMRAIPLSVELW